MLLPGFLARARRGLCPTCGASLPLHGSERFMDCGFCGTRVGIERRLRRRDADVSLPELAATADVASDTQSLARALGESQLELVRCPGCGDKLDARLAHDVVTCPSCA